MKWGIRKRRFRVMRWGWSRRRTTKCLPYFTNGDTGFVENVVVLTRKRRIVTGKGDEMVMDFIVERSMSNGDQRKSVFLTALTNRSDVTVRWFLKSNERSEFEKSGEIASSRTNTDRVVVEGDISGLVKMMDKTGIWCLRVEEARGF